MVKFRIQKQTSVDEVVVIEGELDLGWELVDKPKKDEFANAFDALDARMYALYCRMLKGGQEVGKLSAKEANVVRSILAMVSGIQLPGTAGAIPNAESG